MPTESSILEERIQRTIQRIELLFYQSISPVEIGVQEVEGEPIPAAKAMRSKFTPFAVGESWGRLWSTSWFRVRGSVPPQMRGQEVVICMHLGGMSGEGFTAEGLVFRDGEPFTALNVNRQEIPVATKARSGQKFEFFIEAAANGSVAINAGGGFSGGVSEQAFTVAFAHLAVPDREVMAYFHDFSVAAKAMLALSPQSQRRADLLRALNRSTDLFDPADRSSVKKARPLVLEVLRQKNNALGRHHVTAVGHAHIDTAWLWPLREAMRKCARTFSTALHYMGSYPEYRFSCSQAAQYVWMQNHYPGVFAGIRKAIKKGQWEPIGSMWVEPDCNLISGESLVRQLLYGKRFFSRELGVETKDCWLPDVFGYSAAMPQILREVDVDWFLTQKISWNQINKFPHTTFHWEGIDGTRVLAHFPPCDTYNAQPDPETLLHSEANHAQKAVSPHSLVPFGYGDGGGGPSIAMLEMLRRLKNFSGLPAVAQGTVRGFFQEVERSSASLPVWVGELYLECHRGTYTTQARCKRGNRKSECLLREAEFYDAVSSILDPGRREHAVTPSVAGYDFPEPQGSKGSHRAALNRAWSLTLLNQFHDILPGSSIGWVYEDAARDYGVIAELGHSVLQSSFSSLESLIEISDFTKPLLITNPLGFRRREMIDLPGGQPCLVDVPACGYAVIEASDPAHDSVANPVCVRSSATGVVLENALLRLRFNRRGALVSVFDLEAGREVLVSGEVGNRLQLHPDYPNAYDAWDVDFFNFAVVENLDGLDSMKVRESGPLRGKVRLIRSFGKSRVVQDVILSAGSRRVDFVTEVDWQEEHRLLKVAFPVHVHSSKATYEIQFGSVERPTHRNTSWDAARFEVCAQRWIDLSEIGYGVALLNDCKYGHDVLGHTMRLSLLRGARHPDPEADLGHHTFTYSLFPHVGSWQEAGVVEEASALNTPLRTSPLKPGAGQLPPAGSFFHLNRGSLVIDTVKRAEDSKAVIIRLYEAHGRRGKAELVTALPFTKVMRTNLLEIEKKSPLRLNKGRVALDFRPFELITLKFE